MYLGFRINLPGRQTMGLYDEIYCDVELPDTAAPAAGTWFQTKSFPQSTLSRYRITRDGHLIDSVGNLEIHGYLIFYATDYSDPDSRLLTYRARFTAGQLQSIVRCDEEVDQSKYGLSSFRWYAAAASPESGAESEKGVQPSLVEGKHSGPVRFGGISSKDLELSTDFHDPLTDLGG